MQSEAYADSLPADWADGPTPNRDETLRILRCFVGASLSGVRFTVRDGSVYDVAWIAAVTEAANSVSGRPFVHFVARGYGDASLCAFVEHSDNAATYDAADLIFVDLVADDLILRSNAPDRVSVVPAVLATRRPELPPGWFDSRGRIYHPECGYEYWYDGHAPDMAREVAVDLAWRSEHENEHPDPWVAWADHETARADAAEAEVARLRGLIAPASAASPQRYRCPACRGVGRVAGIAVPERCHRCNGSGQTGPEVPG